jgi:hypothetical protein
MVLFFSKANGMNNPKSIRALFAFPGFIASSKLVGVFGDRYARVIQLKRRKKQPVALTVVTGAEAVTTRRRCGCETSRWLDGVFIWSSNAGGSVVGGAMACM